MEYGTLSKSDIDFEFDDSDSDDNDDVSISTNASSVASSLPRRGVRRMVQKFDQANGLGDDDDDDDDDDDEFLRGIGGDDSDGDSDASIGSEELLSPNNTGDKNRCRIPSVDSNDFGPPIVVPLKTGSDHSDGDVIRNIDTGSRSSRGSRRSSRTSDFSRRVPVRTKSGEGLSGSNHSTGLNCSAHSAASGIRRPPMRTKSGEGIAAQGEEGTSSLRRRPPPRTKSGSSGGLRRRAPERTKSGGNLRGSIKVDGNNTANGKKKAEAPEEDVATDVSEDDEDDSFDQDAVPTSPGRRQKSDGHIEYRERALVRNSARRQKSSDTLGAMREATRNPPSRCHSSAGVISNGRRRGASRSQSSGVMELTGGERDGMVSPDRKPLRRKAPPRTKSGGTLRAPPLET